ERLTGFCTVNNIRPLYRHVFGLVEALNEGEALHGKHRSTVSRVAVVTGGGSGMGRAICHQLADAGRRVAVLDINAGAAVEVAGDITSSGGTACAAVVDVSDRT